MNTFIHFCRTKSIEVSLRPLLHVFALLLCANLILYSLPNHYRTLMTHTGSVLVEYRVIAPACCRYTYNRPIRQMAAEQMLQNQLVSEIWTAEDPNKPAY